MKSLKNISLFKITLLIVLNIVIPNKLLLIVSIAYLIFDNYNNVIIFFILFILITLVNLINVDYIKYGIVESKQDKYIIVDKILYKTKVFDTNFEIGDVIKLDADSSLSTNDYDLKHNIKFTYNSTINKISEFKLRKLISNQIDNLDSKTKAYVKRVVLNEYSNNEEIEDIGYGFSFYYLLLLIKKKNKKLSCALSIIYILLFGFDVKLYLIISDLIVTKLNISRIDRLSIKILVILLINKYLLFNYSIIISLLLSLYFMSKYKNDKFYIAIIQSLLFNQIQLFTLFFYQYLMILRIFMFIISLIVIIIPGLSSFYLMIIECIADILKVINFGVRGRINLILLIILIILFKRFKITNQFIKIIILFMILLTPINNPLKHVTFINVGQGDSSLIKGNLNSYNVLIDTGSTYKYSKLKKELFKQGIYKLDYLIISHDDLDHSGNINNLYKDFKVNNLITVGKDIDLKGDNLEYLYLGRNDNDNDNSLVYLLNIDEYKFLFTGDISSKVENRILNYDEVYDIDVLKVSHHGSKTASSNYFIGAINPKFSIISTSGAYNHPSKEVIDALNSYYVKTYITKEVGSITFYFTNLIDFIKTEIGGFVII
ncbi:MAG: MBL fold metallo-hydrolase [Erysipelotrichaceae bacterium]|nr:MBL fold metallo-hydrolase [Erysipelotrichaceae bacterium]